MVEVNLVLVGLTVLILLFVFAVYLMFRRTLLAFSEGMRDGKGR